jgi:SnoaL-like domain
MTDAARTRRTIGSIGDPLPAILAAYYEAIDASRFDVAAEAFSSVARYAVPPLETIETAPRAVTIGATALARRFAERGPRPWRHRIGLCLARGADALVEGVVVGEHGEETATFAASARIGPDGLLERYLAFSCPGAREALPTDVGADTVPADAVGAVHDYFSDLDAGRFAEAAGHFSDDVLYSHPPYRHTGIDDPQRIEFRGRAELQAAFERRGRASFDHEVLVAIQRGPHAMVEGVVRGLPGGGGGSFVSSLSLASDGTIRRYVSFYCEPEVDFR